MNREQIEHTIQSLQANGYRTSEGAYRLEGDSLLVYWDASVPDEEQGWSWRMVYRNSSGEVDHASSGPLDSIKELTRLIRYAKAEREGNR